MSPKWQVARKLRFRRWTMFKRQSNEIKYSEWSHVKQFVNVLCKSFGGRFQKDPAIGVNIHVITCTTLTKYFLVKNYLLIVLGNFYQKHQMFSSSLIHVRLLEGNVGSLYTIKETAQQQSVDYYYLWSQQKTTNHYYQSYPLNKFN